MGLCRGGLDEDPRDRGAADGILELIARVFDVADENIAASQLAAVIGNETPQPVYETVTRIASLFSRKVCVRRLERGVNFPIQRSYYMRINSIIAY